MTIRVFKQNNQHAVVRMATVDKGDEVLATVYRDGSYDVHAEPQPFETKLPENFDLSKDTYLLSRGSKTETALEALDAKLGDIVPEPKPIYFMEYENSKGKTKTFELMGKKVVDAESAEEFGRKLIADWSNEGQYDVKFSSVHTEPKGEHVGLAQPVELSAEDFADLEATEEISQ